ncbi:hypothetical protein SAMN04487969_103127 [Paenibacillus algorifonticola]|uniref:Uncharacterized protein n=1 Tax=Paenibacillus algorifonticola TaxID=684063 RepID=A0A1I2B3L4_9BACL|nr:hypothetical protein SAMN04487969_103127 [Paenibacillus algorifonticola]
MRQQIIRLYLSVFFITIYRANIKVGKKMLPLRIKLSLNVILKEAVH